MPKLDKDALQKVAYGQCPNCDERFCLDLVDEWHHGLSKKNTFIDALIAKLNLLQLAYTPVQKLLK